MFCLIPAILTSLVVFVPTDETPGPTSSHTPLRSAAREPRDRVSLLSAPDRRVRTTDARMQALIEQGVRRSRTFSSLLSQLDQTDVIVYVERVRNLPAALAGRLLLVSVARDQRYLRIQLGTGGTVEDAIATLAHELQHALEIGVSPEVRNQHALAELYRRIGQAGIGRHTYDTVAAQITGRRVKRELEG